MIRGTFAVFAAALSIACGGANTTPPPSAPAPARAAPPRAPFPDQDWGRVSSPRFFLSFPLPDRAAWTVDDRSGRWLVAVHVPSKSMIWVRSWREGSVVGREACETQARAWRRDLLGVDASALVERRPLPAPAGFDAEVGFSVRKVGTALGGVAVAVGARIRQCVVLAYATRAEGVDAEQLVAARLAFVTERVFARAASVAVEDRVGPLDRP